MWKATSLALMMLVLTPSCASTNAINPECLWAEIIATSKDDVLTRGTKEQIVRHNQLFERRC